LPGMEDEMKRIMARVAALLAVTAGMVVTAQAADWRAGRGLALRHCGKCHVIPGEEIDKAQPAAGAPSFAAMAADRERYNDEQVAAFLSKPHYPMQAIVLSKRDIANVIAWINHIREGRGGK